jgi:hypothetical protein
MAAPELTFLAPPSSGDDRDGDSPTATAGLRMTRGARDAAAGLGVTDGEVRRCLDAPDDVSPDPDAPARTRFRRGDLVVLAGPDGMVLRLDRGDR